MKYLLLFFMVLISISSLSSQTSIQIQTIGEFKPGKIIEVQVSNPVINVPDLKMKYQFNFITKDENGESRFWAFRSEQKAIQFFIPEDAVSMKVKITEMMFSSLDETAVCAEIKRDTEGYFIYDLF